MSDDPVTTTALEKRSEDTLTPITRRIMEITSEVRRKAVREIEQCIGPFITELHNRLVQQALKGRQYLYEENIPFNFVITERWEINIVGELINEAIRKEGLRNVQIQIKKRWLRKCKVLVNADWPKGDDWILESGASYYSDPRRIHSVC